MKAFRSIPVTGMRTSTVATGAASVFTVTGGSVGTSVLVAVGSGVFVGTSV